MGDAAAGQVQAAAAAPAPAAGVAIAASPAVHAQTAVGTQDEVVHGHDRNGAAAFATSAGRLRETGHGMRARVAQLTARPPKEQASAQGRVSIRGTLPRGGARWKGAVEADPTLPPVAASAAAVGQAERFLDAERFQLVEVAPRVPALDGERYACSAQMPAGQHQIVAWGLAPGVG